MYYSRCAAHIFAFFNKASLPPSYAHTQASRVCTVSANVSRQQAWSELAATRVVDLYHFQRSST